MKNNPHIKIINLHKKILNICNNKLCTKWSNSWMYENINYNNNLRYYFLVYMIDNCRLYYNDIQNVKIKLEYDDLMKKYRIDIEIKNTNNHNYWIFKENKFHLVEIYILKIIKNQYKSINNLYYTFNLSNEAYYDIESNKLYEKMVYEQRKEKLDKIKKGITEERL